MALKSWYFAGRWTEYGGFLDRVAADAADDRDRNVRELASAWLSNLEKYTDQYARLKRLQDMPEKTVAEVEAKRSAADFLREQMVIGEVPSISGLCRAGRNTGSFEDAVPGCAGLGGCGSREGV